MIGYKLTDADGYTRRGKVGETLWRVGATVSPVGEYGGMPCGPGCLHYYGSPEEAVLYDSIHGDYGASARLFRVEADGGETDGLKWWTTRPVLVTEELTLPEIDTDLRVAWAICVAPHPTTRKWAVGWLSGTDRSARSAVAARSAVVAAARSVAARSVAAAVAARSVAAAEAAAAVAEAASAMEAARAVAEARTAVAIRAVAEAAARTAVAAEAAAARTAAWATAWATEGAAEGAVRLARAAARAAEATAAEAEATAFPARSMAALDRARRILAGTLNAELYDVEDAP